MNNILEEKKANEFLWVEKYKPKTFDDMALNEKTKNKFKEYIVNKEIPNLLLHGIQGSGKTSTAKILIDSLCVDDNDYIIINGSSDTSVNIVRTLISDFLSTPSYNYETKHKIVFIDEFDFMSTNAQASLRSIMESFYTSGRFIYTANYLSKIIPALQSRCQSYEFKELGKNFVEERIKYILDVEKIKYKDVEVERLISIYYPDFRKIINSLQNNIIKKELIVNTNNILNYDFEIVSYIENILNSLQKNNSKDVRDNINNILNTLSKSEVDYILLYRNIFYHERFYLFVKILANKYFKLHSESMIPEMNFMSFIYELVETVKEKIKIIKT